MAAKKSQQWNLKDLYASSKDPKIESDLQRVEKDARAFQRKYRGKVNSQIKNAEDLLHALEKYENISIRLAKPVIFAQLLFSCATEDPAIGAFLQSCRRRWNTINQHVQFFEIELLAVKGSTLTRWSKNKKVAGFRNFLAKLQQARPHILSEREEQLFSDFSLTGRSAFVRLFTEELGSKRYQLKEKGRSKSLTESAILNMMFDPSRTERAKAAKAFTVGLKENSRRIAFIFNTLLADKETRDGHRGYKRAPDSRHQANEITGRIVDTMVTEVVQVYPSVQEFYRFKARVLKVKKLAYYDRLAPFIKEKRKISYAQAQTLILDAFDRFSPEYAALAEEFFDNPWIDATPRPGKRAGGFCSFLTPDLHPYIFMNYRGSLRDVFTLAHELGHAIHGRLMSSTNYLNFSIPLTVAETASIFSEMLLFEHLLEVFPEPQDQFSLYAGSVENRFGSVFRQVSMHRFEELFHTARRDVGEQSVSAINKLWLKTQKELYGNSIDFKGEYDYWWSYIPHFIHTPFYVYAYAFGELLSIALFQKYKRSGTAFVSQYMDMLAQGASATPVELLQPLGVNLNSKAFWRAGVDDIARQVKKTKALYRAL